MEYTNFLYSVEDGVATIMLNRPEKLNALTVEIWNEMENVMENAVHDQNVKSILLCGKGRSFCAGFDLEMSTKDGKGEVWGQWDGLQKQRQQMMKLWDSPKPIVAAIQGYCLGGGYELMSLADLVIASEDAVFGETEMRYSLMPQPNTLWLCGLRQAKEIMMLAEKFSAAKALEIGLINRVVPAEDLQKEALRVAKKLARMPEETMRMTKRVINEALDAQGYRSMGNWGWDLFLLSKLMVTQLRREFDEIGAEKGMKEAFRWMNERFDIS